MTAREKLNTFLRNDEEELSNEIQRLKDELLEMDPRTDEYADLYEKYAGLLEIKARFKETRDKNVKNPLVLGLAGTVALLLYRALFDRSHDPFFREIGKELIRKFKI